MKITREETNAVIAGADNGTGTRIITLRYYKIVVTRAKKTVIMNERRQ